MAVAGELERLRPDMMAIMIPQMARSMPTARRVIVNLVQAQMNGGRHALVYGLQTSPVWVSEELSDFTEDEAAPHEV